MGNHRSTTLGLVADHCPAALDHYERGTPYDRDQFAVGVAAHAILQALAEAPHADPAAVADATARELVTRGRSFEGVREPPLPPTAVADAVPLALMWHALHPLPEDASPERGLAVDARWLPVPYRSPSVRLRGILDLHYPAVEEVDGEPRAGVAHLDYKSAWTADAADLDSLQMKIQALLCYAHADDPAFIRQEIGNLRTGEVHARTIWLDQEGLALLDAWRREIDLAMTQADATREARPGAGCPGCPYLHACAPARALMDSPEDTAARYVVIDAERARLRPLVAAMAREGDILIPGGSVGYVQTTGRAPREDALLTLAARWGDDLRAFVAAIPPSLGALDGLAQRMIPRAPKGAHKAPREELVASLVVPTVGTTLQIRRTT